MRDFILSYNKDPRDSAGSRLAPFSVILLILPPAVLAGVSKMPEEVLFVGHRLSNIQRKSWGFSLLGSPFEERRDISQKAQENAPHVSLART